MVHVLPTHSNKSKVPLTPKLRPTGSNKHYTSYQIKVPQKGFVVKASLVLIKIPTTLKPQHSRTASEYTSN